MKDIIILYHADCPDGFSAAWAAWRKFGDSADYIGVHHNMPPPKGLKNKEIYIIDFTYSADIMKEMIKNNKRVTGIDHHISRESETKLTQDYVYSTEHSGAVLSWNYFHKEEPVPMLLKYVEGQDLWNFDLPDTKPIVTFLDSFDYDFKTWEKLVSDIEDEGKRQAIIKKGQMMLDYKEEMIERIINENAKLVLFEGYETYAVNAPHEFASRIGSILYERKPPIAIVWVEDKDSVHVSLRSDGSVDVSEIAKKYDGGGHKTSAGFGFATLKKLPWKKIK